LSRLVIVSNRVAKADAKGQAAGGLAVAVLAALRETRGLWFGWSGKTVPHTPGAAQIDDSGSPTYATVDLNRTDYRKYYAGYSNRSLWPLFHYRLDLLHFDPDFFDGYRRVNRQFAHQLLPLLKPKDVIWVHDFHLAVMGEELRRAGVAHPLGFFLHIPFPSLEVFSALPRYEEIGRALAAYDVVGFQTESDLRAFHDYVRLDAGGKVHRNGIVELFGRRLYARAFPIGIDTEDVARLARASGRSLQARRLVDSLSDRRLIIGVDRLDYSKGLVKRFRAFEKLLEAYPANRGNVTLLQIAPPTRSDVHEYSEIRQALETQAGHINGRYADFDWSPIRYLNKGFARSTLMGFFRNSQVGLVTPLRDGMNLVAKEFVAAQPPEDPGVLVLSRFAGAARELDGALIVNPYDIAGVAEALQTALEMPLAERIERWTTMYDAVIRNDVSAWREDFLGVLTRLPGRN